MKTWLKVIALLPAVAAAVTLAVWSVAGAFGGLVNLIRDAPYWLLILAFAGLVSLLTWREEL